MTHENDQTIADADASARDAALEAELPGATAMDPIFRDDEPTPRFCGCESSLCDHNAPADAPYAPYVLGCERIPTGLTRMAFIGDVCDTCADNMAKTNPEWITRVTDVKNWSIAEKIKASIDAAYADWETGGGFSPSARDLVIYALDVTGRGLSADDTDLVADEVDARQIDGQDTSQVAIFLAERLKTPAAPKTSYRTMTVEGSYGSTFQAETDDDAIKQATAAGYDVLDIQSDRSGLVLVIAS